MSCKMYFAQIKSTYTKTQTIIISLQSTLKHIIIPKSHAIHKEEDFEEVILRY